MTFSFSYNNYEPEPKILTLEEKIDDMRIELAEVNRQLEIILRLMDYNDYKQYTRKP